MKDYRKDEIGKKRHAKLKTSEVCNGAVIGIAALWLIWVSTSVLLHVAG
ncbi:hypothetical protein ACFLZ5_10140 [Thermodesulfobacteriota bacterium]